MNCANFINRRQGVAGPRLVPPHLFYGPALACLLLSVACGAPPSGADTAYFEAPITLPQTGTSCDDRTALADMTAALWVGGHDDCALSVDSAALTVSGECPEIRTGITRPLTLAYFLPNPGGNDHIIALALGYATLSGPALTESGVVEVSLGEGDGMLLYTEGQMASLQELAYEELETATPEELAKDWARYRYYGQAGRLDTDKDGCPNITEACAGTLGVAGNTDC